MGPSRLNQLSSTIISIEQRRCFTYRDWCLCICIQAQLALYQFTSRLGTGWTRWGGTIFLSCCCSNGRLPWGAIRKFIGLCESSLISNFVMSSLSQGSCRWIRILFLPMLQLLSNSSPLMPLGPNFLIAVSSCFCSFLWEWKASSTTFSRSLYRWPKVKQMHSSSALTHWFLSTIYAITLSFLLLRDYWQTLLQAAVLYGLDPCG